MIVGLWGEESDELFNGFRISVLQDEKRCWRLIAHFTYIFYHNLKKDCVTRWILMFFKSF
jgi:hypothetical protein